jgi:hypothetical protein
MKSLLFIILALFITDSTNAQISSAKSLAVGNEWIYLSSQNIDTPSQYYVYQEVIGDTTIDQKTYAIIKSVINSNISYDYQRSDSAIIYRYVPSGFPPQYYPAREDTLLNFNLNIKDSLYGYRIMDKSKVFYYDKDRVKIHMYLEQPSLYYDDVYYLEGIGIIEEISGGHALAGNEITSELKASIIENKIFGDSVLLDVKEPKYYTPSKFNLCQNYPNPFNPSTKIIFSLEVSSTITLKIYNILGDEISTIINRQPFTPGSYNVTVNMNGYPTGVYFYRITSANFNSTKKMILIK